MLQLSGKKEIIVFFNSLCEKHSAHEYNLCLCQDFFGDNDVYNKGNAKTQLTSITRK
jgi:hypothetical protein